MAEKTKRCISYTQVVSELSNVAKVMEMLQMEEIVQLYVPAGDNVLLEWLDSLIHEKVLCRVPLHVGKRQFIYCKVDSTLTDEGNIEHYEEQMAVVFGGHQDGCETRPRFTYHARVYRQKGGSYE